MRSCFFFSQTKNSRLCLGIPQQFRTQQAKTTGGSPPGGYFLFSSQTGHIRTFQSRRQRQGEEEKWILSRVQWVPVNTLAALGGWFSGICYPPGKQKTYPHPIQKVGNSSDPQLPFGWDILVSERVHYEVCYLKYKYIYKMLEGIFISKSEKIHENSIISMDRATTWPIPSNVWYTHIDPIKINHSSR